LVPMSVCVDCIVCIRCVAADLCSDACLPGHIEELTSSSGTILSPCYAQNSYPNDALCQWRIQAPAGAVTTQRKAMAYTFYAICVTCKI